MNNNPFQKAVKEQVKGRMSISGPSGSGKTYTALLMATKLVELAGGRIALLDTEGKSSLRYASDFDFDVIDLSGDYNPQRYIEMINAAGEHGYTVLIIDSLSHAWNGTGGVLSIVDKSQMGKNKMSGWIKGRPVQQSLSDAIVQSPVHLICTMRSKTEWDMSKDANGKVKPQKIGLSPVQSSDMEYEFDIAFMLDQQHTMAVSKSRCLPLNEQGDAFTDSGHVIETVYAWLTDGEIPTPPAPQPKSNGNGQPKSPPTGRAWPPTRIDDLFGYWLEKELTEADICRFADVTDKYDHTQWAKYQSNQDASAAIQAAWNAEMDNGGSAEESAVFNYMSYVGKSSNLLFATKPEGAKNNLVATAFEGRGGIRKWGSDELYEQLQLSQYTKLKGENIMSDWIKMVVPVEFFYVFVQDDVDEYCKITGIKGNPEIAF